MVSKVSFNNISATSWLSVLLVEEIGILEENHGPVASNWQIVSHVLHRDSNSQHLWC